MKYTDPHTAGSGIVKLLCWGNAAFTSRLALIKEGVDNYNFRHNDNCVTSVLYLQILLWVLNLGFRWSAFTWILIFYMLECIKALGGQLLYETVLYASICCTSGHYSERKQLLGWAESAVPIATPHLQVPVSKGPTHSLTSVYAVAGPGAQSLSGECISPILNPSPSLSCWHM